MGPKKVERERLARIRLLSLELDHIRQVAIERSRSIDSKSSFIIVAAGFVTGATFTGLVSPASFYIGLVPVAFTVGSMVAAVIALWPTKLWSPIGRSLVSAWVEDPMTAETLEDSILEVKAREIEARDAYNERRSKATRISFRLLIAGLITAFLVVGVNAAIPEGASNGPGTTVTPAPDRAP